MSSSSTTNKGLIIGLSIFAVIALAGMIAGIVIAVNKSKAANAPPGGAPPPSPSGGSSPSPASPSPASPPPASPSPASPPPASPPPPPPCNKAACNMKMQDWIVNKYWAFGGPGGTGFEDCMHCPARGFKSPYQGFKDGTWADCGNSQGCYDYLKLA